MNSNQFGVSSNNTLMWYNIVNDVKTNKFESFLNILYQIRQCILHSFPNIKCTHYKIINKIQLPDIKRKLIAKIFTMNDLVELFDDIMDFIIKSCKQSCVEKNIMFQKYMHSKIESENMLWEDMIPCLFDGIMTRI